MIESAALASSALPFAFVLGLRHGLDPDHIAVIDGLTFRAAERGSKNAPWTGALFAIGHSGSVTAVALAASLLASRWSAPEPLVAAFDWLVVLLLVLVGLLNLKALLQPEPYRPRGWRMHLLPRRLGDSAHPAAALLVGLTFGLVFDTATQAAAWGAAATATGGALAAIGVTLAFSIGMIMVDTADSFTVAVLLRRGSANGSMLRYRRGVGWLIVALSFGAAAWGLVSQLAELSVPDALFTTLGMAMAVAVIAALTFGKTSRPALSASSTDP